MDTGRVGACHKLENKRRKFLIVINDVVKNKYDVYAEYLDHAHEEAEYNYEKSKMFVRRALVRQKVLQKCMKMRKRVMQTKPVFGRYGGKPIEAFGRDIEGFIAHNHPKLRRKRYLETLLNESLEKGAILKQTTVSDRVSSWMERSYTKYKLMKAKRETTTLETIKEKGEKPLQKKQHGIPRLPVLTNPFYSGVRHTEEESETNNTHSDVLKLTDDLDKVDINKNTDTNDDRAEDKHVFSERRTLMLPPIKPSKTMVTTQTG